jgi:hypothetical protein
MQRNIATQARKLWKPGLIAYEHVNMYLRVHRRRGQP